MIDRDAQTTLSLLTDADLVRMLRATASERQPYFTRGEINALLMVAADRLERALAS